MSRSYSKPRIVSDRSKHRVGRGYVSNAHQHGDLFGSKLAGPSKIIRSSNRRIIRDVVIPSTYDNKIDRDEANELAELSKDGYLSRDQQRRKDYLIDKVRGIKFRESKSSHDLQNYMISKDPLFGLRGQEAVQAVGMALLPGGNKFKASVVRSALRYIPRAIGRGSRYFVRGIGRGLSRGVRFVRQLRLPRFTRKNVHVPFDRFIRLKNV